MNRFVIWIFALFILHTHLQATYRIGITNLAGLLGEREMGWRIKKAAEQLGWEVVFDEYGGRKIKKLKDLDFVVSFATNKFVKKECYNYLISSHDQVDYNRFFQNCWRYDGFLLITDPKKYNMHNLHSNYIGYYPTVQETPYQKVALNNIATLLPIWGNRKDDPKFKSFYSLLDQSGFVKFYGILVKDTNFIKQGYVGQIPFDGVSLPRVFQEHGIVLVIHSDGHNRSGIPSGRIFEAAAASAVIISDKNAFVKEQFGDSVFYIDTELSAEEIFSQIQQHMDFIRSYPEIVLEMAKKANQIFNECFGLTKILLDLKDMHEKIKAEQKYPKSSKCYHIYQK